MSHSLRFLQADLLCWTAQAFCQDVVLADSSDMPMIFGGDFASPQWVCHTTVRARTMHKYLFKHLMAPIPSLPPRSSRGLSARERVPIVPLSSRAAALFPEQRHRPAA